MKPLSETSERDLHLQYREAVASIDALPVPDASNWNEWIGWAKPFVIVKCAIRVELERRKNEIT